MGGMAVGAAAGMFSSTRSAESTLNRATWTLVTVFLLLAVVLSAGWLRFDARPGGFSPVVPPDPSSEVIPGDTDATDTDAAAPVTPEEAPAP